MKNKFGCLYRLTPLAIRQGLGDRSDIGVEIKTKSKKLGCIKIRKLNNKTSSYWSIDFWKIYYGKKICLECSGTGEVFVQSDLGGYIITCNACFGNKIINSRIKK